MAEDQNNNEEALTQRERELLTLIEDNFDNGGRLRLSEKNITDKDIQFISQHWPAGLEALYLRDNSIGDAGARDITLPASLKELWLQGNSIGAEGARDLNLPAGLKRLYLKGNNIGDAGARDLNLPTGLEELQLADNGIGAEGARDLTLPASLKELYLWSNNIGAEGARDITLPARIIVLHLTSNNIGDAGARDLTLPASLRRLHLASNSIGGAGVGDLTLPASLKDLDLEDNNVGANIGDLKNLPSGLEKLTLIHNNITDAGFKNIAQLKNLKSLNLYGNNLTDASAPKILEMLDTNRQLTYANIYAGDISEKFRDKIDAKIERNYRAANGLSVKENPQEQAITNSQTVNPQDNSATVASGKKQQTQSTQTEQQPVKKQEQATQTKQQKSQTKKQTAKQGTKSQEHKMADQDKMESHSYTMRGDVQGTERREYDTISAVANGLLDKLGAQNIVLDYDFAKQFLAEKSREVGKDGFEGTFGSYLARNDLVGIYRELNEASSGSELEKAQRDFLTHYLIFTNGITDGKGEICNEAVVVDAMVRAGQEIIVPLVEVTHADVQIQSFLEICDDEVAVAPIIAAVKEPQSKTEMAHVGQVLVMPGQRVGVPGTRQEGQYAVDAANYFMGSPPTDAAAHGGSKLSVWEGARVAVWAQALQDIAKGLKGERQIDTTLARTEVLLKPEEVIIAEISANGNVLPKGVTKGDERRFKFETGSTQEVRLEKDGTPVPVAMGLTSGATISLERKNGGHNNFVDAKTARVDFGALLDTPDGVMHFTSYTVVDNEKAFQETRLAEAQQQYNAAKDNGNTDAANKYLARVHQSADTKLQMDVRQLLNPAVWSLRPYDGVETQNDIVRQMQETIDSIKIDRVHQSLQDKYMGLTHLAPAVLLAEVQKSGLLKQNPVTRQIAARVALDFIHDKSAYGRKQKGENRAEREQAQKDQAMKYGEDAWRAIEKQSLRSPSKIEREVGAGLFSDSASRAAFQAEENAFVSKLSAEKQAEFKQNPDNEKLGALREWTSNVASDKPAMQSMLLAAIAQRTDGSLKHPEVMDALLQTVWFSTRDDSFSVFKLGTGTQGGKELGFKSDRLADKAAKELEQLLGESMKGDLRAQDPNLVRGTFSSVIRLITIGAIDPNRGVNMMDVVSEDAIPALQDMAKNDPDKFAQVSDIFAAYMQRAADAPRSAQFAANIASGLTRRVAEIDGKISPEMQAFYDAADKANNNKSGSSVAVLDFTLMLNNRNWQGLEQATEAAVLRGDDGITVAQMEKENLRRILEKGGVWHRDKQVKKGQENTVDKVVYVTNLNVTHAEKALAAQAAVNGDTNLAALRGPALATALQQNLAVYATLDNADKFTPSENDAGFSGHLNRASPALLAAHAVQMMAAEQDVSQMDARARRKNRGEISKLVNGLSRTGWGAKGKFENMLEDQADALRAGETDLGAVLSDLQQFTQGAHAEKNMALLLRLNDQLTASNNFNASFSQNITGNNSLLAGAAKRAGITLNATSADEGENLGAVLAGMDEATQAKMASLLANPAVLSAMANNNADKVASLLAERGISLIEAAKLAIIIYALRKDDPKQKEDPQEPEPPVEPPGGTPIIPNPYPVPGPGGLPIRPDKPPFIDPGIIPPRPVKPPTPGKAYWDTTAALDTQQKTPISNSSDQLQLDGSGPLLPNVKPRDDTNKIG
jgi:Leucine-rich repeat (LRR) protein